MSATRIALAKLLAWLDFCRAIGWPNNCLASLTDLWWQYHDEQTGELK